MLKYIELIELLLPEAAQAAQTNRKPLRVRIITIKKFAAHTILALTLLATSSAQAGIFNFPKIPKIPFPEPGTFKPAQVCATVWVGFNQDNFGKVIKEKTTWNGLGSSLYARRSWHGGLNPRWSGVDRATSEIRSSKVAPGCTLFLSTDATFAKNGNPVNFEGGIEGKNIVGAGAFAFQGSVGSLECNCGGGDVETVVYSSVMIPD